MCALKYEAIFELLSLDSFFIYRLLILEERRKIRDGIKNFRTFRRLSISRSMERHGFREEGRREGDRFEGRGNPSRRFR